jgi:hypothetical protein
MNVAIYQSNPGGHRVKKYQARLPYMETFGGVAKGKPLAYLNSLLQLSFALNMGNFSDAYKIYSGSDWTVEISKVVAGN